MEGQQKNGGSSGIIWSLIIGFALGLAAGIFAPRLLSPVLPESMRDQDSLVTGIVRAKQREPDRLLVTVHSAEGATLATFRQKVDEISLLVEEGDTLVFELKRYTPFIEDPVISGVKKTGPAPPMGYRTVTDSVVETMDTLGIGDSVQETVTDSMIF